MSDDNQNIIRYSEDEYKEFELAIGQDSINDITDHIERYVGKIDMVYHEIISDKVHIDIHVVNPTKAKPYYTLVTSGMSNKPMNTRGDDANPYMELCISLPSDWKLNHTDFEDENNYWPVRLIKHLARFPHDWNSYFAFGHSIPNSDPPESYAESTELSSVILLQPILTDENFQILKISEKKHIYFYALVPLYETELNRKLTKGTESLLSGFDKYKVTELLDISRTDTTKRKKLFGLF